MDKSIETFLYRHFSADGSLLYVGISLNAISRLAAHYEGSHWSNQISKVEIEKFTTRSAARSAEWQAILKERPLHNIQGRISMLRQQKLEDDENKRKSSYEESRDFLSSKVVQTKVLYFEREIAGLLNMSLGAVRVSIGNGDLGCITLPAKPGLSAHGLPFTPKIAVTGWQLIDWLELLASREKNMRGAK